MYIVIIWIDFDKMTSTNSSAYYNSGDSLIYDSIFHGTNYQGYYHSKQIYCRCNFATNDAL